MYSLITGTQQIFGDQFAIHLAETAREYLATGESPFPSLQMGINRARLPDGGVVQMKNRLPGQSVIWRKCELRTASSEARTAQVAHAMESPFAVQLAPRGRRH